MRPSDTITVNEITSPPEHLFFARAESPFGTIGMAATSLGLTHLWLDTFEGDKGRLTSVFPKARIEEKLSTHHQAALSYFTGEPKPLSLHLTGTAFQLSVWRALLNIPFGRASSYKAIANEIGNRKAVRAVGSAVGKNPVFFIIPCHRVLAHDGSLGGYFYGLEKKQDILNFEAVNR